MPNDLGKVPLQANELEQADRPIEFNQQVYVTVRASLVADEGTEQEETCDAKGLQAGALVSQRLQDVVTLGRCRWSHATL